MFGQASNEVVGYANIEDAARTVGQNVDEEPPVHTVSSAAQGSENEALSRVPGAAQHEVMRCRTGTVTGTELRAVPDLGCTARSQACADCVNLSAHALHRVRDTGWLQRELIGQVAPVRIELSRAHRQQAWQRGRPSSRTARRDGSRRAGPASLNRTQLSLDHLASREPQHMRRSGHDPGEEV